MSKRSTVAHWKIYRAADPASVQAISWGLLAPCQEWAERRIPTYELGEAMVSSRGFRVRYVVKSTWLWLSKSTRNHGTPNIEVLLSMSTLYTYFLPFPMYSMRVGSTLREVNRSGLVFVAPLPPPVALPAAPPAAARRPPEPEPLPEPCPTQRSMVRSLVQGVRSWGSLVEVFGALEGF